MDALCCVQPLTCVRKKELLQETLTTWQAEAFAIQRESNGEILGYMQAINEDIPEIVLKDAAFTGPVVKQWMKTHKKVNIHVPLWTKNMAEQLEAFAEGVTICDTDMLRVMNWKNVLNAALQLKQNSTVLKEGNRVIKIDGCCYRIFVKYGVAVVLETSAKPDFAFTGKEAIRKLFGTEGLHCFRDECMASWFPAPLQVLSSDGF